MVEGGQRHAPSSLPPETPGTHCLGGWLGPIARLEGCGKFRFHRDSILWSSSKIMVIFGNILRMCCDKHSYNQNGPTQCCSVCCKLPKFTKPFRLSDISIWAKNEAHWDILVCLLSDDRDTDRVFKKGAAEVQMYLNCCAVTERLKGS